MDGLIESVQLRIGHKSDPVKISKIGQIWELGAKTALWLRCFLIHAYNIIFLTIGGLHNLQNSFVIRNFPWKWVDLPYFGIFNSVWPIIKYSFHILWKEK